MEGVKRKDLRPCACCGQPLMRGGVITCTRAKVTRLGADLDAVRRQMGLEMMLGSPTLAMAMGTDEELLKSVGREASVVVIAHPSHTSSISELWSKVSTG